jgi:hypothetical protein
MDCNDIFPLYSIKCNAWSRDSIRRHDLTLERHVI